MSLSPGSKGTSCSFLCLWSYTQAGNCAESCQGSWEQLCYISFMVEVLLFRLSDTLKLENFHSYQCITSRTLAQPSPPYPISDIKPNLHFLRDRGNQGDWLPICLCKFFLFMEMYKAVKKNSCGAGGKIVLALGFLFLHHKNQTAKEGGSRSNHVQYINLQAHSCQYVMIQELQLSGAGLLLFYVAQQFIYKDW